MSSKEIFHNSGPSTNPCGTQHVISFQTMPDAVCANTTQSRMILRRYTGTFAFASASRMRIHGIELNAFRISRLMAAPNWRFFIADAASFFSLLAALIIEQPARNPYWSAFKARFTRKCFLSRSTMTCLKMFPTVSSMLSGRNEAGSRTGLPGFCNSTSRANFHQIGNTPIFNAMLKTMSSIPGLAQCTMVHTLFGIPSRPGAFLALARIQSGFNP